MHRVTIAALLATALLAAAPAAGQTAADSTAIRGAALDYIEGWYTGDVARMERAVHPELVKRIVSRDAESDRFWLSTMGSSQLVSGVRAGFGTQTPEAERRTEVTILDVYGNIASARVDAGAWVDHLQLARWGDGWRIVNVLWELRPEAADRG